MTTMAAPARAPAARAPAFPVTVPTTRRAAVQRRTAAATAERPRRVIPRRRLGLTRAATDTRAQAVRSRLGERHGLRTFRGGDRSPAAVRAAHRGRLAARHARGA